MPVIAEKSVETQIIAGVAVKTCGKCKMILAHCICTCVYQPPTAKPHSDLSKCALCDSISNDGIWVDINLYWCGTCAAEIEEGGGMTTKHIRLKLRGNSKAIEFFHYVCTQIDNDWPWSPKKIANATPCKKCGGMLYVSAVLEAEEIRKLGAEAGLSKCKVSYFGDVKHCFEGGK